LPKRSSSALIQIADVPARENLEGERKIITALFADIKGSMELIEDLDPEDARAIVDPALKLMIDAVHHYEGYVAQSTGDGIFALFGAPVAHEDHPQRSLLAALRMQAEVKRYAEKLRAEKGVNLQVRVGANTGEVVVREIRTGKHTEYLPIGHSTGVAARLEALAVPGSIVISQSLRKLVEGYFALKPLGRARIKGIREPLEIYEVTGHGTLRTRLQRAAARGYTKFVGRQHEMETMKDAAELAKSGHGQIVAVVAEPGVGKSRLFDEFKAENQSAWMVLQAASLSYGKGSPYRPVLDLLHSYFEVDLGDEGRRRREKVSDKVLSLDRKLEDALPYLFGLLGLIQDNDPLAGMDAQIRRRRTHEALKRILLRESLNQPVMLFFEDLHWIDDETQAFLNLLADSIATAKLLLLVSYRPEYSHKWNSKTYYTQLRLDPLGGQSADEMLDALLGVNPQTSDHPLAPLKRLIIEKTEGTPLFIEEIVQALQEDGALLRIGTVKLTRPLETLKVPSTVQDILASRIDRLAGAEKELLQTLAVIGMDFPLALVREVVTNPDDELSRKLSDLQLAEFIYEQPTAGDVEYTFKHALTQEVAANSVLLERRKILHEQIGAAIEKLYAERLDDRIDQLAYHYAQSKNLQKAVEFLTMAAQRAVEQGAFAEAEEFYRRAIDALEMTGETPERNRQELELLIELGGTYVASRGYTAAETAATYDRAAALVERFGEPLDVVLAWAGQFAQPLLQGKIEKARAFANRIWAIAERCHSKNAQSHARHFQGCSNYQAGALDEARSYLTEAIALYVEEDALARPTDQGHEALSFLALTEWQRGMIDTARSRIKEARALAERLHKPYVLAYQRYFEAHLSALLRDARECQRLAEVGLEQIAGQPLPLFFDIFRILRGWALAQQGRCGEGVSFTRAGLTGFKAGGYGLSIGLYHAFLAETLFLSNSLAEASATVEEGISVVGDQLIDLPYLLWLRGELLVPSAHEPVIAHNSSGRRLSLESAEASLRKSISVANRIGAKTVALRAATSLARLLNIRSRSSEARDVVAPILRGFTEGFDTADLKDAKVLLDELSNLP
jgi:class 3 adenylate cyclase